MEFNLSQIDFKSNKVRAVIGVVLLVVVGLLAMCVG